MRKQFTLESFEICQYYYEMEIYWQSFTLYVRQKPNCVGEHGGGGVLVFSGRQIWPFP